MDDFSKKFVQAIRSNETPIAPKFEHVKDETLESYAREFERLMTGTSQKNHATVRFAAVGISSVIAAIYHEANEPSFQGHEPNEALSNALYAVVENLYRQEKTNQLT